MFDLVEIQKDEKVITMQQKVAKVIKKAELIIAAEPLSNDLQMTTALDVTKEIKVIYREIKERNDYFLKPAKEFIANINSIFVVTKEKLEETEANLKEKLVDYNRRQEAEKRKIEEANRKKLEELEQKRQEAIEQGKEKQAVKLQEKAMAVEMQAPVVNKTTKTESASGTFKKEMTFEVTNPDEVPRMYCGPDPQKLRYAVKSGVKEIAGVRIFERTVMSVR